MNNPKNLLLIALIFLGFLLYAEWQQDYGPKPVANVTSSESSTLSTSAIDELDKNASNNNTDDIPQVEQATLSVTDEPSKLTTKQSAELITVTTNVLKLQIDTLGGSIIYAELLNYPVTKKATENVVLLSKDSVNNYYAQSGLISAQQSITHTDLYSAEKLNYSITDGQVDIPLSINKNGIKLTKIYTINANNYLIELKDSVSNQTNSAWLGQQYRQLQRNNPWHNNTPSFNDASRMSFKGAAYFEPNEGYIKVDFEDFQEDKINANVSTQAWVAMVQHYFFASFIVNDSNNKIESKYLKDSSTPYLIRSTSNPYQVESGSSKEIETKLYIGPKLQAQLPSIAAGLDLTVDYGIFTAIAKPLFWVLNKIHSVVGNWGWSIIFLTILIKLLFFKLTEKQYKSMARMRKLQPRITTLKERHKGNKQKFNEEMMKLYKKEKVNPMGGCLPMLVQIPVFIALYWVLLESVELRQAPFMLWLQDLSSPDPYFILPAINALAMFMTQKLSPTPGMDPMQAKIMKFMPIGFSVMFAFFQSGLVLYWAVNSSLSLVQQWIITKRIDNDPNA
jgi:YidC/Oxa1 family membrane protein insertase